MTSKPKYITSYFSLRNKNFKMFFLFEIAKLESENWDI